jgi:threonine aldolase
MDTIDLRSDTVSQPTPAMRQAMASAVVGDDVYGEDPTINALQTYAADLLGKEAALYFPTATMSNIAATMTHCGRGDELILPKKAHIFQYEQGGASHLGGVLMNTLAIDAHGQMSLAEVEAAIRPDDQHMPRTALICLENTTGATGVPLSVAYTEQVGALAKKHNLKLHIDGARLFNAAVALGVEPHQLVAAADSVQLCLSKGLCAPLGALLVGSKEFIAKAYRYRKVLGGGMRQAGVAAAAGMIALSEMRQRLAEDHQTAAILADSLSAVPGLSVEPVPMRTNMVFFTLPQGIDEPEFIAELKTRGVILRGGPRFRLVTHYWVTPEKAAFAANAIAEVVGLLAPAGVAQAVNHNAQGGY